MLRNKRLYEVIATATHFASDKSIEGYYCAQVLKTKSEFPDVYLDSSDKMEYHLHSDVIMQSQK
jgi:hypothetical protein